MEAKLSELVGRLKSAAADNLKAVVLYGSAATGEFLEKHSDLNILCLVERAGSSDLERLHPVAELLNALGSRLVVVLPFQPFCVVSLPPWLFIKTMKGRKACLIQQQRVGVLRDREINRRPTGRPWPPGKAHRLRPRSRRSMS